eukprot:TCALIF_04164-PA protein Name:"Protein of unknown function" AED:0.03 eAED:0.03 QI:13/1/0/1/1/1/2/0/116
MTLPDQEIGVALFDGQMSGLTNLSRRGDALLEAETDHFLLTFALQAKDLRCAYGWRKQRLKGEVVANVEKVTLNLKIKQMLPTSTPPELLSKLKKIPIPLPPLPKTMTKNEKVYLH